MFEQMSEPLVFKASAQLKLSSSADIMASGVFQLINTLYLLLCSYLGGHFFLL